MSSGRSIVGNFYAMTGIKSMRLNPVRVVGFGAIALCAWGQAVRAEFRNSSAEYGFDSGGLVAFVDFDGQRTTLESRAREFDSKYPGEHIPLPPFWGGYLVEPDRIEFWQGRSDRLHDRLCFLREAERWRAERLYP